jgi:hypothetical protein
MARVPVLGPASVGENLTSNVQLFPAATEVPQVFVRAKSPLMAIFEIFSVSVPLLVSVTVWGSLLWPTT